MLFLLVSLACNPNSDSDGDGVLDEFDCFPENPDLGIGIPTWADGDGDGFGDGEMIWSCELGDGLAEVPGDCDDTDESAYPGAPEVCDGADNNCSGAVDDSATDAPTWFADFDQDGQGTASWGVVACDAPAGYVDSDTDCDDADAAVYLGADELCNGVDDNCDGTTDEDSALDVTTWYPDADVDGFGAPDVSVLACEQPVDHVADNTDCDDDKPQVNPGADEICDALDNDCDGAVDFDASLPGDYADLDDVFENAPADQHICVGTGTFGGGGYTRSEGLTLHGSGVDKTIIDANYQQLLALGDGGDFGLTELQVVNAVAVDSSGEGGMVYFDQPSELWLRNVKLTDGACETSDYCDGGIAYWDDGGSMVASDVEVDGFTYDGSNNVRSSMYGLFYGDYVDFDIANMEIHDMDVSGVGSIYSTTIYVNNGELNIDGLHLHDNTVDGERIYSPTLKAEEADTPVVVHNVTIEDNTTTGASNGHTLGLNLGGSSEVRNLKVLNNTATFSEMHVYGLGIYSSYGSHDWENVLVAGNTVTIEGEGEGFVYGGLVFAEQFSVSLTNADFVDNTFVGFDTVYGAAVYAYAVDLSLWNTNIVNNDFGADTAIEGIVQLEYSELVEGYNNVWNTPSDFGYVYDYDDGDLGVSPAYNVDPGYSDSANGDFTLASGSPMIDAGNPAVLDADGSVSDVGAYGGPNGNSW